jgi:hypothetical protein
MILIIFLKVRRAYAERQSSSLILETPCELVNVDRARLAIAYKEIPENERGGISVERPYIFRSFAHRPRVHPTHFSAYPRNPGKAAQHQIWEVARATTAAPLYFDPMKLSVPSEKHAGPDERHAPRRATTVNPADSRKKPKNRQMATFIDGGYGAANNPAEEAYHEVTTNNERVGTFVSVGTGRRFTNRFNPGVINTARGAFDALGDPELAHEKVDALSRERESGFSYFRFNEQHALADTEFDEWIPKSSGQKTVDKIELAFQRWAIEPDIQIHFQICAKELVRRRRLRTADTSRWERYAWGSSFDCKENCRETGDMWWKYRAEFEEHLRSAQHQVTPSRPIDQIVKESRTMWAYKPAD